MYFFLYDVMFNEKKVNLLYYVLNVIKLWYINLIKLKFLEKLIILI